MSTGPNITWACSHSHHLVALAMDIAPDLRPIQKIATIYGGSGFTPVATNVFAQTSSALIW
jgi:hypothetical protein